MNIHASLVYFNKMIDVLESSPELKKTLKGIVLQCGFAAGGAAVGGVCGGPIGALLGTILGGFFGYANSDEYGSLIAVLKNLTEDERRDLVNKVQQLVGSIAIEDLVTYIQSEVHRQLLLETIGKNVRQSG